jgi:hypothetical protein
VDEREYHDALIKEYAEAGAQCRAIEQLTRTALAVFVPAATGIAAFAATPYTGPLGEFLLVLAGLFYSLVLLHTVRRSRAYYDAYLGRAKEIEGKILRDGVPVLKLYTIGKQVSEGLKRPSNKQAIEAVFWVAAAYFVVASSIAGYLLVVARCAS